MTAETAKISRRLVKIRTLYEYGMHTRVKIFAGIRRTQVDSARSSKELIHHSPNHRHWIDTLLHIWTIAESSRRWMPSPDRFLFTVLHWWIIRGVQNMESPDLGEHHIFNPCTAVWARWGCVKDPLSFQFFDDAVMTKWSMAARKKHNVRNVCHANDTTDLALLSIIKRQTTGTFSVFHLCN